VDASNPRRAPDGKLIFKVVDKPCPFDKLINIIRKAII
jgi:hypothetical protein